jgi:hypothetical protein
MSFWGNGALLFGQEEVDNPAPFPMWSRTVAVGDDFGVVAPSFLKGVRENGEVVESSVVVDTLGKLDHGPIPPGEASGGNSG